MKKVLVITYYWPPAGGGGVQRWVKFIKYLPKNGWQPIVYTPKNAAYPTMDESLGREVSDSIEVIKHPIWEPRNLYKKLFQKKGSQSGKKKDNIDNLFYIPSNERTWKQNLSIWIRGNVVIPDARVYWVKPSIKFLTKYLKENPVDVIVTSGPPHSLHLIGQALQQQLKIKWIADFRDPWTDIEYYDKMMLTSWADKKYKQLERTVIQKADSVIAVAPFWKKKFDVLGSKNCQVITNGYDETDFNHQAPPLSDKFLLTHAGTLANDRNPTELWAVLELLKKEIPGFADDLRIQILGNTDTKVVTDLTKYQLNEQLIDSGYVSHDEAIRIMQRSQVLLLLINQSSFNAPGRMTGKIFEYLASERPILLIGLEESDPADVLKKTEAGKSVNFGDKEKLKVILTEYYKLYKKGELLINSKTYKQYSRKNLTIQLSELLDAQL